MDGMEKIRTALASRGHENYGEGISQLEHAIQCAAFAERDGASEPLIAAAYLHDIGAELRRDARLPYPGATHALVVAMNYGGTEPDGPVAKYASGDDYHEVLRGRLRELHAGLERETGRTINARPDVDFGPVWEGGARWRWVVEVPPGKAAG